MTEKVFQLKKDSDLYNQYMGSKQENKKYAILLKDFLLQYDIKLDETMMFFTSENLSIKLSSENEEKYETSIKKCDNQYGISKFKINSKINKHFKKEVSSKIDFKKIENYRFWWMDYISKGKYRLWHNNENVYGYLSSEYSNDIKLSNDMRELKMSEYYKIIEDIKSTK